MGNPPNLPLDYEKPSATFSTWGRAIITLVIAGPILLLLALVVLEFLF